jgi:hypothetical protein
MMVIGYVSRTRPDTSAFALVDLSRKIKHVWIALGRSPMEWDKRSSQYRHRRPGAAHGRDRNTEAAGAPILPMWKPAPIRRGNPFPGSKLRALLKAIPSLTATRFGWSNVIRRPSVPLCGMRRP